jgi:hypothetical protein
MAMMSVSLQRAPMAAMGRFVLAHLSQVGPTAPLCLTHSATRNLKLLGRCEWERVVFSGTFGTENASVAMPFRPDDDRARVGRLQDCVQRPGYGGGPQRRLERAEGTFFPSPPPPLIY